MPEEDKEGGEPGNSADSSFSAEPGIGMEPVQHEESESAVAQEEEVKAAIDEAQSEECEPSPDVTKDHSEESQTTSGLHGAEIATRRPPQAAHANVKGGSSQRKQNDGPRRYSFYVGPGNNSELVRATLERRPWWELGKEDDPDLNLKWMQVRNRSVAEYVRRLGNKQFLNHLDGLTCIGRKNELYANLKAHCEKERINVHEIAPPTFVITVGENCNEYLEFCRVCRQLESRTNKGLAAVKAVKNVVSAVSAMQHAVALTKGLAGNNHSNSNNNNTNNETSAAPAQNSESSTEGADAAAAADGEAAATTLTAPLKHTGKPTVVSPRETTVQNTGIKSPQKTKETEAIKSFAAPKGRMTRADAISSTNTAGDRNIWIVKPTNNNRGNGIRVFRSFAQIEDHLKKKSLGTQVIVQKYIERPLLYKRRKFDIRCLVMVDPQMQVYVYRDAYCRTSTQEYSLDNINDLFIHLTNYAVQKKNKKYSKNLEEDELDEDEVMEEGNNLSMSELSSFLQELNPNGPDGTDVMNKIREIIVRVFQAVWRKLNPMREKNTFEVFGWDFLLDEEMNVWLIEVNTNPYIGCSSSLLRTIFTGMLEGLARKCIDPHFPPPPGMEKESVPDVEGADLWDKVYPEKDPRLQHVAYSSETKRAARTVAASG